MTNITDCDAQGTARGGSNGRAVRLPHILRLLNCTALVLVATGCRAPNDRADRSGAAYAPNKSADTKGLNTLLARIPDKTANAKGLMDVLASAAQSGETINSTLEDLKGRTLTHDEQREAVRLKGLMETLNENLGPFVESYLKATLTSIESLDRRSTGVNDALEAANDSVRKALGLRPGSAEHQRALHAASQSNKETKDLTAGGHMDDYRSHKRIIQALNMIDLRVDMEPEQLEEMFKRATALLKKPAEE